MPHAFIRPLAGEPPALRSAAGYDLHDFQAITRLYHSCGELGRGHRFPIQFHHHAPGQQVLLLKKLGEATGDNETDFASIGGDRHRGSLRPPPPRAIQRCIVVIGPAGPGDYRLARPPVVIHALLMRSMTGYGRGERVHEGTRVVIELRSVNRRQAEVSLRLPAELEPLEGRIRDELLKSVARGRVEVKVSVELPPDASGSRVNGPLAAAYARELSDLTARLGLVGGVTLDAVLRCPGVLQTGATEGDPEALWKVVEPALRQSLDAFNAMRDREGEALAADLSARIAELRSAVARIRRQAPGVIQRYREQMLQRIRAAGIEGLKAEDERVLKEVVLFADRSDINEELTRLESHFVQFDDSLRSREPLGRKLDFLAQEINREVNTTGSKANDAAIAADVVLLKTELERFREQAQNVE